MYNHTAPSHQPPSPNYMPPSTPSPLASSPGSVSRNERSHSIEKSKMTTPKFHAHMKNALVFCSQGRQTHHINQSPSPVLMSRKKEQNNENHPRNKKHEKRNVMHTINTPFRGSHLIRRTQRLTRLGLSSHQSRRRLAIRYQCSPRYLRTPIRRTFRRKRFR